MKGERETERQRLREIQKHRHTETPTQISDTQVYRGGPSYSDSEI